MFTLKAARENESGALMIEAIIVYGVTMLLLFMVLSIFSVMYQHWNVQTIANESAARIAQTYKYTMADPVTGYVAVDAIDDVRPYRYVWNPGESQRVARDKVTAYAQDRLSRTTFAQNVAAPVVRVSVEKDGLSRQHLEVEIQGSYKVPFGEVLDFLGMQGTITYDVTAYAQCVDMTDYISTVDFVANKGSMKQLGSSTLGVVDKALKLIGRFVNK